jgi:AraC-like DNA-binding protein
MERKKIVIAGEKGPTQAIKNYLPKCYDTEFLYFGERIKDMTGIEFLFLCCDYRCRLKSCTEIFAFAASYRELPFAMIKFLCLNRNIFRKDIFSLSFFVAYDLDPGQEFLIKEMRYSEFYARNTVKRIHPSNILHKVARIQNEIAENPTEYFDLKKAARLVSLSPCWLSKRFREVSGITLEKFISKNRLCFALWNIVGTDKLIKEVAYSAGYKPLSLCKILKKEFGFTPRSIRNTIFFS